MSTIALAILLVVGQVLWFFIGAYVGWNAKAVVDKNKPQANNTKQKEQGCSLLV